MFHPGWRQRALAATRERAFDLLIIGGGITGCGILLDAAQRGLSALLLEKGDFACGTSSRSSKLIHGGLRYLKQGQIGVTRASSRERELQLRSSPHLVEPLPFLFPSYRGDRTPAWMVGLGLHIYDRLHGGPHRHRRLTADEIDALAPGLSRRQLRRVLAYRDARVDDARLTWAVAATAFSHGGWVLTRSAVEAGQRDASGRLNGVVARDLTNGEAITPRASLMINAAGVWVDEVRQRLGFSGGRLRPSRGTHILFSRRSLPIEAALAVQSPDDGRPVFLIPHPEGVLVGTTDHFHDGDLDDPRPTAEEVSYLLRTVRSAFPDSSLGESDIRGCFAGLRPILDRGAESPSKASRAEEIWEEQGLLTIAGGKLTTWRKMAQETVDQALRYLPPERTRRIFPCATAGTSLAGLAPPDLAARLAAVHPLEMPVAEGMARRLGALAWSACGMARDAQELRPLASGLDLCAAEARAHLRFGAVVHLEDLLLRRVRLGMWNPAQARQLVPRLEAVARDEMGWSAADWDRQQEGFAAAVQAWSPEGILRAPGGGSRG